MNAWIVTEGQARAMDDEGLLNSFERSCDGECDYREAREVLRTEVLRRLRAKASQ